MGRLLEVDGLVTEFDVEGGAIRPVNEVSFHLDDGEAVCLVGESGCGKSMAALSIMGLIPAAGRVASGRILFRDRNLPDLTDMEMRKIRGKEVAMVFQEPMTSLNPVFTIGNQIAEAVLVHEKVSKKAAMERAVELLERVAIPDPKARAAAYPHQLSGGMRQRAMIAMALSCGPSLLIADEPTTALDVTIQAQFLDLLRRLQGETGMAVLLITHDLGVVAEFASRVYVLYCGRVVERAPTKALFDDPKHPYTAGLMQSVPTLTGDRSGRLRTIEGVVPDLRSLPRGCAFEERCPLAREECSLAVPPMRELPGGRAARCVLYPTEASHG